MLEGLVAWVINTYIGEYFDDLNADHLSVGLLQGEVELENLPLKKDAFNFSGYPLEIRSGCVGKIKLQIPVYRLHSEPWVIFIEKLYIVIGPTSKITYDEEKENQSSLQRKLACLQKQEADWKVVNDAKKESNYYGVYSNWKSYSTSLVANIVENVQLNVRDVHIRYEDDSSCTNSPFACGFIIRGLTAQSTDANWVPQFVKGESNDMTWKLAKLEGLSVYWDTKTVQMMNNLNREEMMDTMTKLLDVNILPDGSFQDKEYILSSVDATARFKRNCSSEVLKSPHNPRFVCDIQLEKIPLYFSQNQYREILQWEKSFNFLCVRWNYRKYRPLDSVSSCPRLWWKFAISSFMEPVREESKVKNWTFVLQQARDIKEYSNIYKEYFKSPETLSAEFKVRKEQLEVKLSLDVLVILRELVIEESLRKKTVVSPNGKEVKAGFLQWMFPSWVGWYSMPACDSIDENLEVKTIEEKETILEEELLTVFNAAAVDALLKRDALFVQLNFCLYRGTFVLLQNETDENSTCDNEKIGKKTLCVKPVIELEFSDVFIKFETKPRTRGVQFELKLGALYLRDQIFVDSHFPNIIAAQNRDMCFMSSQPGVDILPFSDKKLTEENQDVNRWLFELIYEKNPQDIQSNYRLVICTKPLDVVCNLDLIRIVVGIFTSAVDDTATEQSSFCLPSAASEHYKHFKEHTKAELQQTWDRMIVGGHRSKKEWCIKLEIAAPQILIPENIFDANSNVLIFVLGDLHVFNTLKTSSSHISSNSFTFEEDDFYTPCSTPDDMEQSMDVVKVTEPCKTSELFYKGLYERYTLELQNMQVLVSSLKDSWKFAQLRGSSSLHILDRFSINIQFYRRTFITDDPLWPSLVFIASLPKLTAHISELKVGAVEACIEGLKTYFGSSPEHGTLRKLSNDVSSLNAVESDVSDITANKIDKSFFLLMQFSVEKLSFDIQSQSQSIAELQVCGVKSSFSKHHGETVLMLTVHGLLIADALQTFGPDFELLVASHKYVSMDNSSGKILSTDYVEIGDSISSPAPLQSPVLPAEDSLPWAEEEPDEEALIFVEFKLKNEESESCEELSSINVKCNNLDIIANQETIIELVGLLQRIGIRSKDKSRNVLPIKKAKPQMNFLQKRSSRTEISFNFRLLNVLLLRAVKRGFIGHKLATATLRDAHIKATIGSSTEIFGTLGGVQVLDLVTEDTKYQTIVSLGKRGSAITNSSYMETNQQTSEYKEALTFRITTKTDQENNYNETDVFLRMASLYYVHSPQLLFELTCCAAEFKAYLKSLAISIKSAAAEVAKGIVAKNPALYLNYESSQDIPVNCVTASIEDAFNLCFCCDIFLKSPVIVLPHSSSSPEVFMAHLGHIALCNKPSTENSMGNVLHSQFMFDKLRVEISGMSLYYVNIDSDVSSSVSNMEESMAETFASVWSITESSRCPILHDTAIEVLVQPFQEIISMLCGLKLRDLLEDSPRKIECDVEVVSPLNVDFTKQHYEQMLKFLNNLSYNSAISSEDQPFTDILNGNCAISSPAEMSSRTMRLPDPTTSRLSVQKHHRLPICYSFVLPSLKVELREYMNEKNSLLKLIFQEFHLKYNQIAPCESLLQATLSSLLMEDMQDHSDTSCRSLLISSKMEKKRESSSIYSLPCISSSCPDIHRNSSSVSCTVLSPSLPDNLYTENVFSQQSSAKSKIGRFVSRQQQQTSYPNTPPPSPTAKHIDDLRSNNALVSLEVRFVDYDWNDSMTYNKRCIYIDVDFNSLDIVFSLHPWNIVFDFFTTGGSSMKPDDVPSFTGDSYSIYQKNTDLLMDEAITPVPASYDTELNISVKSLTVVLCKPKYDLASANISNFHSHFCKKNDSFVLDGHLGSLSILDLTPMGRLYPERLLTTGTEALHFHVHSNSELTTADYSRELNVKIDLSSIVYLHTQRLITEITAFFQYFHEKGHRISKASGSSSVNQVRTYSNASYGHNTHVLMNFIAASPVIVIPSHALSKNLLIIKPKSIAVMNCITKRSCQVEREELPTLIQLDEVENNDPVSCQDAISIVFNDVVIYSGSHSSNSEQHSQGLFKLGFPSYTVIADENLLQEAFAFDLQIDRDICYSPYDQESGIKISGLLSSVYVTLNMAQYKLIRSILSQNFGETLEEGIYDPCKEVEQFVLLDTNEEVSTTMSFHIELSNVTLELHNDPETVHHGGSMLAKFDFIKSQLSYVVFSNNNKDIDIFSNEIRISDVRYTGCPANRRPNVFTNILLPNKGRALSTLQAELHYRLSNNATKFSIILNNMRVMGIVDFINSTLDYLRCPLDSPNPAESNVEHEYKKDDNSMEIKLNVTNTEFVVVEDTSVFDSNAVVAKTTAVIVWKSNDAEKPLSFNLEQFEMFSCILGIEDETALSIIDPVNVSIDLMNKLNSPIASLQSQDEFQTLEVSALNLYMRFSYYDLVMFIKIMESLKRQLGWSASPSQSPKLSLDPGKALSGLGFSPGDCEQALKICGGNLDDAALWLTQNAVPNVKAAHEVDICKEDPSTSSQKSKSRTLYSIELRMDSIGLCIIDDCRDADVPILEFHLTDVNVTQKLLGNQEGYGLGNISLDYYNCSLSGWEPLVEPWKCQTKWYSTESFEDSTKKLVLNMSTEDVVNINLTSAFLKLFKMVKDNWTEDYFDRSTSNGNNSGFNKQRSQLMPFALKNLSGCKLWFTTQVLTSKRFAMIKDVAHSYRPSAQDTNSWKPVENFASSLFTFGKRVKLRHQDSHQETLHQIVARVEGWQNCLPVSVDHVGVYFRNLVPVSDSFPTCHQDRIIFKVKLGENAQKCVTIESALSITNKLEDVLEVKLECPGALYGVKEEILLVTSTETLPIPLPYVHSQIWVRPLDRSLAFCTEPIQWKIAAKPGEMLGYARQCHSTGMTLKTYRFCVCVEQRNYPESLDGEQFCDASSYSSTQLPTIPGHRIVILPCLEVHNMLPIELSFFISNYNAIGRLKSGEKQAICDVDLSKAFSFGVSIENFEPSSSVNISFTARHYPSSLEMRDVLNRVLYLQLRVILTAASSMQLIISSPYWLVNKIGLPLVFKQDATQIEAAGQFEEHEMARSMVPFLFSFYDDDAPMMCSMRIGKQLHERGVPLWCSHFRLEKGVQVRRLHVAHGDSRPDSVYIIGIEVTPGKGKYKDSSIVTLSPRYHLDNRSRHVLEFCQKFAIHESRNHVLSAMPECNFPFHWPRIDLDNLLCVRISSIPQCYWSGGFVIESIQSFFINMRDSDGVSHFLQTEIVLHGATYHVIFTDAESFPPPIRIDNHSEVSVTYYQTNVSEERLKTTVRPHTSVPYALDEPMLPPYITCSAAGGSLVTYNVNIFREGNQLFYENFIYIAFTATLMGENDVLKKSDFSNSFHGQELVLDVPTATRVCLSRKEAGKRSQLWRMTSNGRLEHEGSSPPSDMTKSQSSSQGGQKLVLDIAGLGPQPQEYIPLMLRKPDARRHNTQTWSFTPDGRLCCGYANMYVQVVNGYSNLRPGSYAVLGPMPQSSSLKTNMSIPVEQAVCRQKLRGGCGVLSVKVDPDGPTRVLKISDLKEKTSSATSVKYPNENDASVLRNPKKKSRLGAFELQLCLKLPKGLGLSIVNRWNEDLIYMMMHDIVIEFCRSPPLLTIDGSFKSIQIDNQLRETEWPVCLFVTPLNKTDNQLHMPAVHFSVHYNDSSLVNTKIFRHLIVIVKNLTVYLEEFLVLKLLQFFGFDQTSDEMDTVNRSYNELQSSLFRQVTSDPRYYFSTLKLALQQVRLSVHTTDHLPPDLRSLKHKLGLRLISFEDAAINLDSFLKVHPFETCHFLLDSIVDHYKQELKSQAAKILGAVDFIGNPLGLMNDVSDGLSSLIHDGNIGGLFKHVAHGLSDSAAKISESLSDGLGSVAIDEKHQLKRKQIRQGISSSTGNDHLMAGIKGFGFGILGGFTSIFTETLEGAAQEGFQGLLSGLGRGLVGTVAKPAVGILDLASGTASAIRDTSKKSPRLIQPHRRPPRQNVGHGCLLPTYSLQHALDQELLYKLNDKNYHELFIAKEFIRSKDEDIQVLVSSKRVYFLNVSPPSSSSILLKVPLCDLLKSCYVSSNRGQRHYIQLHLKDGSLSPGMRMSSSKIVEANELSCKKPLVRCDSGEVAEKAVIQINYAKSLYEERRYTLAEEESEIALF